jgi:hypothetical protein
MEPATGIGRARPTFAAEAMETGTGLGACSELQLVLVMGQADERLVVAPFFEYLGRRCTGG